MCRIVGVILFAFIQSVLLPSVQAKAEKCQWTLSLNETRNQMQDCFSDVVKSQLNGTNVGKCGTVSEFGTSMQSHYKNVIKECKISNGSYTYIVNEFVQFVNYSLVNGFKEFYEDISCVMNLEKNITACVTNELGFFPTSEKQNHSTWNKKITPIYSERNCQKSREIKTCTLNVLSSCKNTTSRYVASLFDFNLKICDQLKKNEIEDPGKPVPSKMSKSAIAAAVLVPLIIILVAIGLFIKLKHKINCYNVKAQ